MAVRYDLPTWSGFSVSASWGDDDFWDVAARYSGECNGIKLRSRLPTTSGATATSSGPRLIDTASASLAIAGSELPERLPIPISATLGRLLPGSVPTSSTCRPVCGAMVAYGHLDDNCRRVTAVHTGYDTWYFKAGLRERWTHWATRCSTASICGTTMATTSHLRCRTSSRSAVDVYDSTCTSGVLVSCRRSTRLPCRSGSATVTCVDDDSAASAATVATPVALAAIAATRLPVRQVRRSDQLLILADPLSLSNSNRPGNPRAVFSLLLSPRATARCTYGRLAAADAIATAASVSRRLMAMTESLRVIATSLREIEAARVGTSSNDACRSAIALRACAAECRRDASVGRRCRLRLSQGRPDRRALPALQGAHARGRQGLRVQRLWLPDANAFRFTDADIAKLQVADVRLANRKPPRTSARRSRRRSPGWSSGSMLRSARRHDGLATTLAGNGDPTQMDCVDIATNLTSYLLVLERHKLLRHHSVGPSM